MAATIPSSPEAPKDADALGLCVIGLGIGRRYLDAARDSAALRIASVCSARQERVDEATAAYAVPFGATDYRAAIDRPDVDAVIVASPDRLHAEHAAFALECGKHVLCEKPTTTTTDDARRLVELVERTGRTFLAGHSFRFTPQFASLHQLASSGGLGELYLGTGAYEQDLWGMASRPQDYWRFADPQDMFLGAALHVVDLLAWCLGPVAEVHAYANHQLPFYPADENYVASLQFEGGAIGQVLVALASRRRTKFTVSLTLHGAAGAASANQREPAIHTDLGATPRDAPPDAGTIAVQPANPFAAELAHLAACIRSAETPLASVCDGARAVAACVAAGQSVAGRRPIRPERF